MSTETKTQATNGNGYHTNPTERERILEEVRARNEHKRDEFDKHIHEEHARELLEGSGISPEVVNARGYQTLERQTASDSRTRLKALGIPKWAWKEDWNLPGLLIPIWGAKGERVSAQFKPWSPVNHQGSIRKYANCMGQTNRLDIHPFNRDKIIDPTVELWITEGVKKADSLATREVCAIALNGVFGWRKNLETLGDWEDVKIRGREIVICFDADAKAKPQVLEAMKRLGKWLKGPKGAKQVHYLIVPAEYNGKTTKGVDDYFVAGGTLDTLNPHRSLTTPIPANTDATFTEAVMAQTVADELLADSYIYVDGEGWMCWNGRRWANTSPKRVEEEIRLYFIDKHTTASQGLATGDATREDVEGWYKFLTEGKIGKVRGLTEAIVMRDAAELDADPDLVNTPSGVVDLANGGTVHPHDPDLLMTRITAGDYRPRFTHKDWDTALEALPPGPRGWMQVLMGHGITGHNTKGGITPVLQGSGENGKGLLTTDGAVLALGDYASVASTKIFQSEKEHSEEVATLRGKRLLVAEELTAGKVLNVGSIKRIQDNSSITARYLYGHLMTFPATHTLMATTNYIPVVNETDHGIWRRLVMIRFPYTFKKPEEWNPETATEWEKLGDTELKDRVKYNESNQWDAIVTWAIEGALRYYADPKHALDKPDEIKEATLQWRKDSDHILGFWDEEIEPDPVRGIPALDLLDKFNAWMRARGHQEWSLTTFSSRFLQHFATAEHRVTSKRQTNPKHVDRYAKADRDGPASTAYDVDVVNGSKPTVFRGVRFQFAEPDWSSDPLDAPF
jgi:P4 family phage/plasmid primase-like protien